MTFIEDADSGINLGNPAGFMASKVMEGSSANQALRDWREAGGSFTRQDWLRGYANVRETLANSPTIGAIDPTAIPDAQQYGEWAMGRGGQFATQVQMQVLDRGSGVVGTAPFTYITDEPHTPEDAIAAGIDLYTNDEAAQRYGQRVLGGLPSAMWQTVPYK